MTANAANVNTGGSIAPIKNVASCFALVEALISTPAHMPNMGVFSGYSGYGKTLAATYCSNRYGAVMIEVFDSWSRRKFCQAILQELGVPSPRGSVSDMMDEIVERLGDEPERPLIIDEAHTAMQRHLIELIRQINKLARVPILLVGEEELPSKLAAYENADNLVLERVLAQACDVEDTRILARLYFPKLKFDDDLLGDFVAQTKGRARRIVSTLNAAATFATNHGLRELDRSSYTGTVYTGARPQRSRVA